MQLFDHSYEVLVSGCRTLTSLYINFTSCFVHPQNTVTTCIIFLVFAKAKVCNMNNNNHIGYNNINICRKDVLRCHCKHKGRDMRKLFLNLFVCQPLCVVLDHLSVCLRNILSVYQPAAVFPSFAYGLLLLLLLKMDPPHLNKGTQRKHQNCGILVYWIRCNYPLKQRR